MTVQDVLSPMKKKTGTPEHGLRRLWEILDQRRLDGLPIHSKQGLADKLGISKQAITPWRTHIPVKHVLEIEKLVGLDRTIQRPDVYPPESGKRK